MTGDPSLPDQRPDVAGAILQGYLEKKSWRNPHWNVRFFVLKRDSLNYYKDVDKLKAANTATK